jgi:hypothetical protein
VRKHFLYFKEVDVNEKRRYIGFIEQQKGAPARVVFRYLSRNETKGQLMATEEELLQEIMYELKDALEEDIPRAELLQATEDDSGILYPSFMKLVKAKAEEYKDSSGYRRLCSVPSFTLSLVSASRIRRHYTHCPWFKTHILQKMLNVHGGVSDVYVLQRMRRLIVVHLQVHC